MAQVLSLSELRQWAQGQKVVLCHGAFDLVHPGHLEHLRQARALGDKLVVTVTADRFISKGPGRPAFPAAVRADFLAHLDVVDAVAVIDEPSALPAIEALHPAFYVKGSDYIDRNGGKLAQERAAVEHWGGCLAFTSGPTHSSSALMNSYLPTVAPEVRAFLDEVKTYYGIDDVLEWLRRASQVAATAIGEPIRDQYVFVHPEGKSAKENIVVFRHLSDAQYAGGIDAVARHLRQFCASVLVLPGAETITKRRYVEQAFNQKLFEVVEGNDAPRHLALPAQFEGLVVVADFGHGLIPETSDAMLIRKRSPFLALTVQANGLNYGFNTLAKWPSADYVVCDEHELRLAAQSRQASLRHLLREWHDKLRAKLSIVTQGHQGCLAYDGLRFIQCPALADRVIDRMGAGDAFLGATAPLTYVGAPVEIIALVGSVAAALKVRIVGNQPILREDVERWCRSLLA